MTHFITLLAWVLPMNIDHQLLCKDLTKMFSRMVLRLVKQLLFAVIAEFICYNDIYKMNVRQLIPFNIFYENLNWLGEHGHHVHPSWLLSWCSLFLLSCLFSVYSSFSSTGRGTLLVGVASPSIIETLSISLRRKKGNKWIRSCNKTTFLPGDVTWLTTVLTWSK